jgi:hypothetical protein
MSTHILGRAVAPSAEAQRVAPAWTQLGWLATGLVLGFAVPFVLADTLDLNRDVFYGLYGAIVLAFFAAWARATDQSLAAAARRRWRPMLLLAALAGAVLVLIVYRTDEATSRPDGLELIGALLWRGLFYGAIDGLLLSAFPILVVFAAFAGTRLRERRAGLVAIGAIALAASLAMTAVYHLGYSDYRGEKLRKPITGDLIWSAPTLLTLNPLGAPIAHAAMHAAAVAHSYETEVFLPPHE